MIRQSNSPMLYSSSRGSSLYEENIDGVYSQKIIKSHYILANFHVPFVYERLPDIPLPQVDGDFYKWPDFDDRLHVLVDQTAYLSNIEKIDYLVSCLKGNVT